MDDDDDDDNNDNNDDHKNDDDRENDDDYKMFVRLHQCSSVTHATVTRVLL